ncbi:MAG: DegT/DnrJ/EryC1/StrS family aminotransferase [Bacteroidales bacterium]|nr:DegT/DnrJ/EryC1/StrS family aminotransferase [Bacteroidales bacterium]
MSIRYPVYMPGLQGNEKKYVNDCLDSSWISSRGKYVSAFEEHFADYLGIEHATAVNNGTVAIHVALLALGIGPGDEVIVPTLTYIATVNPVLYVGATPVFADCDKTYWQIDPEDVKRKITSKTKAVIAVHLYGHPCPMDELVEICTQNNIFLIEDCAESLGSTYKGKHTGTFGDIAAFSFFGNKTITTGEGGMVVTKSKATIEKATNLKNQGISSEIQYWHVIIGYNYRMTNICAAIGLAQLENINPVIKQKARVADTYKSLFLNSGIHIQPQHPDAFHSYWMCSFLLPQNINRDHFRAYLEEFGVESRPVFYPVHTLPMYEVYAQEMSFQNSDEISRRGITLPSYPSLSYDDITFIANKVLDYIKQYE